MTQGITIDTIAAARARGRDVVLTTPTLPSTSFSRMVGADVWLKAENLQRTGSFKIRGGMNAVAQLPDTARSAGVVAASAGNHAQGVALAAAENGVPATVFMPESAAIPKIAATKAYGADIRLAGANLAEATDHARAFEAETAVTADAREAVTGKIECHNAVFCANEGIISRQVWVVAPAPCLADSPPARHS